jgi:S1-C subfamily serine protease
VTVGIVSSAGRDPSDLGLKQKTDYIQTDAAINQGNSGGPLINLDGKVIGINTMKLAGAGGIGFAIPIDAATHVIAQLRANKVVARPYLGLRMLALTGGIARQERKLNGLPEGVEHGVLIVKVNAWKTLMI